MMSRPPADDLVQQVNAAIRTHFRATVKRDGRRLEYAPEELQGDKEFILERVRVDWWVLRYASEALRGDKEVVAAALRKNGCAFEFVSEHICLCVRKEFVHWPSCPSYDFWTRVADYIEKCLARSLAISKVLQVIQDRYKMPDLAIKRIEDKINSI